MRQGRHQQHDFSHHVLVWLAGRPAEGYAVVTWGYSRESGGLKRVFLETERHNIFEVRVKTP